MKSDSNKAINRVTKKLLKPMGFIRLSDRYWAYDGGWWLARLNFDPSGWSKGSYGDVGLQCLLTGTAGWIYDGVASPRLRVELDDDESQFECKFEEMVDQLLPIVLELVNTIHNPADFIRQLRARNLMRFPEFYKAMLLGLAGEISDSKAMFQAVINSSDSRNHHLANQFGACVALELLENRPRYLDFADHLVFQTRSLVFLPDGGPNLPQFPWRS